MDVVIFNNPARNQLRKLNAWFLSDVAGTMYFKVSSEMKDWNSYAVHMADQSKAVLMK